MRRFGYLNLSLAFILVSGSAAWAAGEIDSHRVWGEGLFGMHIAPPDANNPSDTADGSGIYRDEFGALRDKSMLPDMLTIDQTNRQIDNNGLAVLNPAYFDSFAQPTTVGIPQRTTSAMFSPTNMYTSPGLSANNMSYAGGYGQYGPINNLDLIRAGITSDQKTINGPQAINPVGVISNYSRVVMPSEPIPGQSVFRAAGNPRGLGPAINSRRFTPIARAQAAATLAPPVVAIPPTPSILPPSTVVTTRVAARRIASRPAPAMTAQAASLSSIGPVNGYIRYGDEKVTLFGDRGTVTETPKGAVVMRLPDSTVVVRDNATMHRQIAGIAKPTY